MRLGVYITCMDEENLITPCVKGVQKVFPEVEVIELGSLDGSLAKLESLDVPIHLEGRMGGAEFTQLKNRYSSKWDWVFWVDGDEVWPEDQLRILKANYEANKYWTAFRIGWRNLVVVDDQIYASSVVMNGPKFIDTSVHEFRRAWPKEVMIGGNDSKQSHSVAGNQWCWHGKMLNRSSYIQKHRNKERLGYYQRFGKYHPTAIWEPLDSLPF